MSLIHNLLNRYEVVVVEGIGCFERICRGGFKGITNRYFVAVLNLYDLVFVDYNFADCAVGLLNVVLE